MAIQRVKLTNYRAFGPEPTTIPTTADGDFGAINVFVGPNGSGKTALMNALKAAVARGSENSQAILWPGLDVMHARCADHHEHGKPWKIEVAFEFSDGTPGGTLTASRDSSPEAEVQREYVTGATRTDGVPNEVYNRLFPFGWPRQIVKLDQPAFNGDAVKSPEVYQAEWDEIQKDADEYLGAPLCTKTDIATARRCPQCGSMDGDPSAKRRCYRCDQPYQKDIARPRDVGLCFLDQNGFPLLQGSDGVAHFLHVIMEVRKHTWPTTFVLEEPDVYMHPGMQKEFMRYVRSVALDGPRHQFFITTHSPYIMNWTATAAREESKDVYVYRLQYERATGSTVERVKPDDGWDLLEELGHKPSDVLHPNGLIWVEGPSDIHYLKVWVDLWRKEHGRKRVRWDLDCAFLTYGTKKNIMYVDAGLPSLHESDVTRVADFCMSLGTTAVGIALVIDQDPGEYPGDRENKERAKDRVESAGGTVWFSDHPESKTVESYANPTLYETARLRCRASDRKRKPAVARVFEELARAQDSLAGAVNLKTDIMKRLEVLSDAIDEWGTEKR